MLKPLVSELKESGVDLMFRRRHIALVLLLVVLSLAAIGWQRSRPGPRLQQENIPQIRVGMTQDEVEALLGGPPGDYGVNQGGDAYSTLERFHWPADSIRRIWFDDACQLEISFDADNRVDCVHKRAGFNRHPPLGFFENRVRTIRLKIGR